MLPEARVVHRTPGRLRLRIPSRLKDHAYFEHVCQTLAESSAVSEVVANPATASVLILHRDDADVILTLGAERHLFQPAAHPPEPPTVLEHAYVALHAVDRSLSERTHHRLDLPTAAFFGLAMAGTLQVFRGAVLPAGVTLYSTAAAILLGAGRSGDSPSFGPPGKHSTPAPPSEPHGDGAPT